MEHYLKDNEITDYSKESVFFADIDRYRYRLIEKTSGRIKGRVLDIGCGGGKVFFKEKNKLFSLDISQKNNSSQSIKSEGDALMMPFKNGSFNCLIMSEVLEHLIDFSASLSEAERVLAEGGKLIITVPYRERIKKHLCIHCNKLTPENAHLHSFDIDSLERALKERNFRILKAKLFENRLLYTIHFFSFFRKFPIDFIDYIDIIIGTWYNKYNKLLLVAEKRASGSVGRAHPSQG